MREVINIPDTQLELHDNFQCFFKKLKFEIERHMMNGTNLVCGPSELETIDMFLDAFKNSKMIPKGCGDLIDRNEVGNLADRLCATECGCCIMEECFYEQATPIIPADEKGTEECEN